MTVSQFEAFANEVLREVRYRDWRFRVMERAFVFYLQVEFEAPDSDTGEVETQSGRKWLLSPFMTRSEIVLTALKAVLTAEEHEARERFLYRGRALFGPHVDVEALFEVANREERRKTHTAAGA